MDALTSAGASAPATPGAAAVPSGPELPPQGPRHVRGLPHLLYRNNAALFYRLLGLNASDRKTYFKLMMPRVLGKSAQWLLDRETQENYALYHYSNSGSRKHAIRKYFSKPKFPAQRKRRPPMASIDLAILAYYYGFPASVAALDRPALESTLAGDGDAQKTLSALIDGTEEFFQRFWMVWRPVHAQLLRWSELTEQLREQTILGVLVLITISESLGPLELAQSIVPALADEFPHMKILYGEDEPDEEDKATATAAEIDNVYTSDQAEPRTVQERWIKTLRAMSAQVTALEKGFAGSEVFVRLAEHYDALTVIGLEGDRERRASRGLSTSQFIGRVRELIEAHHADWLAPALPVAQEAWKIIPAERDRLPEHLRQDAVDWLAEQLERHAERAARCAEFDQQLRPPGTDARAESPAPPQKPSEIRRVRTKLAYFTDKRKTIERGVIQYLTRGQPLPVAKKKPPSDQNTPPPPPPPPPPDDGEDQSDDAASTPPEPPLVVPRPPPAKRGTPLAVAAAAVLLNEQTDLERGVHQVDLQWALINQAQLLYAHRYSEAHSANTELLPAPLLQAAALAPFVYDDASTASIAYQEALIELDLGKVQQHFEHKRALGQYAIGLAASLQAAMFFPASGAVQLLRASNHSLPPDFSLLLTELANLGDQGIQFTLEDFGTTPALTRDSQYRHERVRPIVQGIGTQLPLAIEYFRRAAPATQTLEDEAGCHAARAALEALRATLSGSPPKNWQSADLTTWLTLPSRAINVSGAIDSEAIVRFAADGFTYESLAQHAVTARELPLVRVLLYEIERTGSQDPAQQTLRSFVEAHQQFIRDYDSRAEAVQSRLQEAQRLSSITQDDYQAYSTWLEDLKRSARADQPKPPALESELDNIARMLNDTHHTRLSTLEAEVASLRSALQSRSGDPARQWIEQVERALASGNLPATQRYIEHLREYLEQDASQIRLHRYRVLEDRRGHRNETRSPLTLADELKIAGLDGAATALPNAKRPFTVSLIFGTPAAGLAEVPYAVESLHRIDGNRSVPSRMRTLSADQIVLLHDLRQSTRGVGTNAVEQHILDLEMPGLSDDPGLAEEIMERMYALRPGSTQGTLRVVLRFGPKAAWEWFAAHCTPLEAHEVMVPLLPWTRSALRMLLSDLKLPSGPRDVERLQQHTGGWYQLMAPLLRTRNAQDLADLDPWLASEPAFSTDPAAAREALRSFGIYDVPHVSSIFAALIANGVHHEFDPDLLKLVIADNPTHADVHADVLMAWSERLGLFRRIGSHGAERLQLDPIVSALLARSTQP